ncbi:hypothetical protein ODJ79_15230 [Actinoplanes sp. KI2]|uniref:hypothetical protein n=1 Tax=Actinoplanes sp. KI2 TaxID=2983315 RepID=UPI0021D58B11|nr:hypothetical protein [Actinoplanes sp. KI2]MCU7725078.1 hypothetical protein [Actinoplanes sp. KI2]
MTPAEKAFLERAGQEAQQEVDRLGFDLDAGLAAVKQRALSAADHRPHRAPACRMPKGPARSGAKGMAIARYGAIHFTPAKTAFFALIMAFVLVVAGYACQQQIRSTSAAARDSAIVRDLPAAAPPPGLPKPAPGSARTFPTLSQSHLATVQRPADSTGLTAAAPEPTLAATSGLPARPDESGAGTCARKPIVLPLDTGVELDRCAVGAKNTDVVYNGVGLVVNESIATRSAPTGGTSVTQFECERRFDSPKYPEAPRPVVAAACLNSGQGVAYIDVRGLTAKEAVFNLFFQAEK